MKFIKTMALLALAAYFSSVSADETARLQGLLKKLNQMKADFVQHSFDGAGSLLQTQQGTMVLKHPNKFRWQGEAPYEQLLISNGQTLWQYDQDLEQVTIQTLDQRLASTPALLLSGTVASLNKEFEIYAEQLDQEQHFVLIPKSKEVLFDRLRLEFNEEGLLRRMVIKDEVGQKTAIRLKNIRIDPVVDDKDFQFVPPEGVDIISQQ